VNTLLKQARATSTRYEENERANEFIKLAIAIGASRRMSDPIRTQVRKMSPRLDSRRSSSVTSSNR
jgi:hypothetical protein